MFLMEDLKDLSCEKFESLLENQWKSDTFADCIREVYLTTGAVQSPLTRTLVVQEAAQHKTILMQKRPFQDLIRESGDFVVDLIQEL
jgi:hypothetical protein